MTDAPAPAWRIRRAVPQEAVLVAELAARTFIESYTADNDPEDVAAYVTTSFGAAEQERELRDPDTTTLVAEIDGALVAYAQLGRGPVPACVGGPSPLEIRRFYVARPWQGVGLAVGLMDAVRQAAEAAGAATLWLGVWERNARALAFYRRCGFHDVGVQPFQLGRDVQRDTVMQCPVMSGAPVSVGSSAP